MIRDKTGIKRILFITLSNIGDIVLTTPILPVLRKEFPWASIDVMSGPNGEEIFSGHPDVREYRMYDKFAKLRLKGRLIRELRREKYDLIIDLRNSLFPLLIGSRYRTPLMRAKAPSAPHKKDQHLLRLKGLGMDTGAAPFSFYVGRQDDDYIDKVLTESGVKKKFVAVSPGAKSHIKRWTVEGFASCSDRLIDELGLDVVMVGDDWDAAIIKEISGRMKTRALDLSGKFTLRRLGALFKRSALLITNDSAPMHIACAVGSAVLAIFGPTDPGKYGPAGKRDVIIKKALPCSPCEAAQCVNVKGRECMNSISPDEVFNAAREILTNT